MLNGNRLLFLIAIALVFVVSIFVNFRFIQNYDSQWLLYCADLILQGKKNYYDFFETNPPLIFLILLPIVFFAKILAINSFTALMFFFFSLVAGLLFLEKKILDMIFLNENLFKYSTLLSIVVAELIFPSEAFTEREHLALILFIPYFLLLVARYLNVPMSKISAIGIGFLAMIGFSLKPYFLIPLILIEVCYWAHARKLLTPFRVETITIFLGMLFYLLLIYLFFPEYYDLILPFVKSVYIPAYGIVPFAKLLILVPTMFIIISIVFSILYLWVCKSKEALHGYLQLLILAVFGFLCAALLPGQYWYYHFYPAFSLSFILLSTILACSLEKFAKSTYQHIAYKAMSFSLAAFVLILGQLTQLLLCFVLFIASIKGSDGVIYQLIQFDKKVGAGKTLLVFSNLTNIDVLRKHGALITSRFPGMWPISGIVRLQVQGKMTEFELRKGQFFNMLDEDILKNMPDYLFLDHTGYWFFYKGRLIQNQYLPFLLRNPHLKCLLNVAQPVQYSRYFDIYKINKTLARQCYKVD